MKNYEKYEDYISEYKGDYFCNYFVKPNILESDCCDGVNCSRCYMLQMLWLMKEYEEPEVDWSKVEVDTPILVRQGNNGKWLERHFAKYENGDVYAWVDGQTSWTGADKIKWKYARLPEDEESGKEPEIDWSEVNVDTPILVKEREDGDWVERYFAEYNNGTVFAWTGGATSWNSHNMMMAWKYAKLAESGEE